MNWVRILRLRWTLRALDLSNNSPANVFNFFNEASLPKHIRDGKRTGRYAGVNTSDTICLPLVYQHGGVWVNVGIILLVHLD
jgi:hypothetical protein